MLERLARECYLIRYHWLRRSPIWRRSTTAERAQSILREALGEADLRVLEKIEAGHSVVVKLNGERLAKFASSPRDAWRLLVESLLLECLRPRLGERVPASIYHGYIHPFAVQTFLEGRPIADGDLPLCEMPLPEALFERLCLDIQRIHSLRPNLKLRLFGKHLPVFQAIGRLFCVVPILPYVRHKSRLLRYAFRCLTGCFDSRQWGWCHLDWHTGNVLRSEAGTLRYIDFALAAWAPTSLDWAHIVPPESISRFRRIMNRHHLRAPSRHLMRAAIVLTTCYDARYDRKLPWRETARRTDAIIERCRK